MGKEQQGEPAKCVGIINMPYTKDQKREWAKKVRIFRKGIAQNILGGICSVCGSDDSIHYHHKDREVKTKNISAMWTCGLDKFINEIIKCIPMCGRCHKKAHEAKHGTLSRYSKHGCRCQLCKSVWNNWHREYKRNRYVRVV